MTVALPVQSHGPVAIFDLIANFLEKCHFRTAADAVRAQCSEKEFVLEADFAKNFRGLVDGSALLLSELESLAYTGQPSKAAEETEAVLGQIVDGLMRKLMASGHSLSDEKLVSSIDEVLNTEAFDKLTVMEGAADPGFENLGINDADVQKYWEQIQKGSTKEPVVEAEAPAMADAKPAVPGEVPAEAEAEKPQPLPQQQFATQMQPPVPSSHYVQRKPRGTGTDEEWDKDDEYHDDDDPGYRIREIFEAELLAELSTKMAAGRAPTAQERPAALDEVEHGGQGSASTSQQRSEVVDELSGAVSPAPMAPPATTGPVGVEMTSTGSPLPPKEPAVAWPGGEGGATSQVVEGDGVAKGTAEAAAPSTEKRSASPTFGGAAPGSESAQAATGQSVAFPAVSQEVDADAEKRREERKAAEADKEELLLQQQSVGQQELEMQLKQKQRKGLKYAASGDPFYPVELDGVVFDSFGLRIVFERDKTGFEESKEFPIRMNHVVAARYQILEYLGSAAFSRAVQCLDLETNKMVCMKIIKNDKDFFDQSLDEIKLLKYINVNGDVDDHCVLRLYDYFYHKEHLIIVTELLRDNLYEFSKFNRECGDEPYFTLGRLQKIAKQVLTALDYVHSLRLIHCDLKPENILIRSYSRCEVKVIDFGSSCFVDDHLSSYVQSRSYRAPEVMLGLPYDQKIDLWSLGCILAELWTGYVLFQNDSVQSLLARVLGIIGEFPYHLMTRGRYVPQYFTQDGQLYQEIEGPPCPERGRRLHLLVPKKTSLEQRMRTESDEFLDFLSKLLQLDPSKRPTASEALEHPWLTKCKYSDGL
jgi:serine/threonine protein kinase